MKSVLKIIAATFILILPACAQTGYDVFFGNRSSGDIFADAQVRSLADAACNGNSRRIAALVAEGADPNAEGDDGITPIFWAVQCRSVSGITGLLEVGADPDRLLLERYLPITIAAAYTDSRYLEALLRGGANPNAYYIGADFAIDEAIFINIQTGSWRNLDLLVEYGLDWDMLGDPALGKYSRTLLGGVLTDRRYCKALEYIRQGPRVNEEMLLSVTRAGIVQTGSELAQCQAEIDRILLDRIGGEKAFQRFQDSR
ncbi:MAG: ankyrin repeat domain-containing protein [Aquisalinus sp.]|nr:ankyrin repeat domain-containing protein [Aquisalinus sp.]